MFVEEARDIFEIRIEGFDEWKKRPHKHNFFEIVYVEQGRGLQCINQHEFKYRPGNVFLLPPMDCHSFKIIEPSRFYFVRFTDHYFMNSEKLADYKDWFDRMAYILANYNKIPGDIIGSDRERAFLIQTIKSIYQEFLTRDSYSESIISGAMASILNILARSIEKQYVDEANDLHSRFGDILRYLHNHISQPELIRVSQLADRFGISQNYFSEYFKKHAGVSLTDYISKSKLRLVETKVLHTDMTLKEIAHQLNFTDSSHLAKTFKNAYGMTIKEFKVSGSKCCA